MKWRDLARQPCAIARSSAVVGDRWTFLLLRDCFSGVRTFDAFHRRLGISRSIVSERLKTLVDEGVLRRSAYQDHPVRYEYRLTTKGLDLYPILLSLVRWGNTYCMDDQG